MVRYEVHWNRRQINASAYSIDLMASETFRCYSDLHEKRDEIERTVYE